MQGKLKLDESSIKTKEDIIKNLTSSINKLNEKQGRTRKDKKTKHQITRYNRKSLMKQIRITSAKEKKQKKIRK